MSTPPPFLVRFLDRERKRFPPQGMTRAEFDRALAEARGLVAELEELRAAARQKRLNIMPLADAA